MLRNWWAASSTSRTWSLPRRATMKCWYAHGWCRCVSYRHGGRDGFPIPCRWSPVTKRSAWWKLSAKGDARETRRSRGVVVQLLRSARVVPTTVRRPATQFLGLNFAGVRLADGSYPCPRTASRSIRCSSASRRSPLTASPVRSIPSWFPGDVRWRSRTPGCGIQTEPARRSIDEGRS